MFGFSQKVGIGWLVSLGIYDIIRERKARKKLLRKAICSFLAWGSEKDGTSVNKRRKTINKKE